MVQSRIKAVEKMDAEAPEPVEIDQVWRFSIPCSGPLGRPIISVDDVSFDYTPELPNGTKKNESEYLLQKVNFGVDLDSRIAILGANGQGKQRCSTFTHSSPCSDCLTLALSLTPYRKDYFTQLDHGQVATPQGLLFCESGTSNCSLQSAACHKFRFETVSS